MRLVHYNDPRDTLDKIQRQFASCCNMFDPQLSEATVEESHWQPAVDIREEEDKFTICADLPGIDPNDIEITMDRGVLTLKGERTETNKDESNGYKRVECVSGNFYRRFSLPDITDPDRIEAQGKHGVLQITLPKQDKILPRKISVTS